MHVRDQKPDFHLVSKYIILWLSCFLCQVGMIILLLWEIKCLKIEHQEKFQYKEVLIDACYYYYLL